MLKMKSVLLMVVFILCSDFVLCAEINPSESSSLQFSQRSEKRVKRQQQSDPADQFFDNVFQIPISTLNAVNELIKSTRPVIRRARERIQQQYQAWQQSQPNNNNNRPKPNRRPK